MTISIEKMVQPSSLQMVLKNGILTINVIEKEAPP
jgi:HSP20 family molecular chaperone IbpA